MIPVWTLGVVPFIKGLDHHHKPHLIAEAHEFRGRHIVGSPDGIATHIFQKGQLMAKSIYVDGRPQRAEVVMVADTLELAPLPIEEEAFISLELDAAYAEERFIGILTSAVHIKGGDGRIAMGRLRRPESRFFDSQFLHEWLAGKYIFDCREGNHFSIKIFQRSPAFDHFALRSHDGSLNMHGGGRPAHFGSRDIRPPDWHIGHLGGTYKVDIPVETGTRIPAGRERKIF